MCTIATSRLIEERKQWKKNHPFVSNLLEKKLLKNQTSKTFFVCKDFVARPVINPDGSRNIFDWECAIPVEKGFLKLRMIFQNDYPLNPPECFFEPTLTHPSIDSSGRVALPLLEKRNWMPCTLIKHILLAVRDILIEESNGNSLN